MANRKISVTNFYTGKKKRITRCDNVDEMIQTIQRQFSIEGNFSLKAKIGDDEFDIETEQDVDGLLEAEELIVYSTEDTVVNADKLVKIEDEEFRIDVIPLRTAAIVQRHRNLLIHDLDLPGMVKELQDLKNFLRLAYYGTATSADAQIEVQDVGFTVTKLCEHSKLTLGMFAANCGDVLEKLRNAYLYLIDGFDDMTLLNLKSVADISKKMTLASAELKELFDDGIESAKRALVATQKEQAVQQKLKVDTATQKKEATEEKEMKEGALPRYEMLLDLSIEEIDNRQIALDYERDKEKKFSESETLSKLFAELIEAKEVPSATAQNKLSEAIETKRIVLQKKIETNEKIRRFINTIKNQEETEKIVDCALRALHKAVSGMKGLSDIMLKAGLFWTSLSTVVDNMKGESDSLKDKVTTSAEYERVVKSKLWRSETFKTEAVTYLSVWVAVMDICLAHNGDMDKVTQGLHEFLRENPTREEAAAGITDICSEFAKHLDASDEELKRNQQSIEDEMIRRQRRQRPADATCLPTHHIATQHHLNLDQENTLQDPCNSPVKQWYSLLDLVTGTTDPQMELNGRYRSKSTEHLIRGSDHKNTSLSLRQVRRQRVKSAPLDGPKRSKGKHKSPHKSNSPNKFRPTCTLLDISPGGQAAENLKNLHPEMVSNHLRHSSPKIIFSTSGQKDSTHTCMKEVAGNLRGMPQEEPSLALGVVSNCKDEALTEKLSGMPMTPLRHPPVSTKAEEFSQKEKSTKCSELANTTCTRRCTSRRRNVALMGLMSRKPELFQNSCCAMKEAACPEYLAQKGN